MRELLILQNLTDALRDKIKVLENEHGVFLRQIKDIAEKYQNAELLIILSSHLGKLCIINAEHRAVVSALNDSILALETEKNEKETQAPAKN